MADLRYCFRQLHPEFLEMPAEVVHAFRNLGRIAEPHQPILRVEQQFPKVLVLASGWACRERWLPNGGRVIFDLYIPGDVVGLDRLLVDYPIDEIVALTTCCYHVLQWKGLNDVLICEPKLAAYLLKHLVQEKQELERQCTRLARLPASVRTTVFLAQLHARILPRMGNKDRGSSSIDVPLTQQHLADHLGLNVIYVNRTLRSLRIAGVIETHRGGLSITDAARLKSLGNDYLTVA